MDVNSILLLAVFFSFLLAFVFSMFGQGGGSVYSPHAYPTWLFGIDIHFNIPCAKSNNIAVSRLYFLPEQDD